MYKSHMMAMFFLAAASSAALSIPLNNHPSSSEDTSSQEHLAGKKIITDRKTLESRQMCLQAFGHSQFCQCLFNGQTVSWSFPVYVQVVTRQKDGNPHEGFTEEQIHMFEQIIDLRNNCISELGFH